MEFGKGNYLNNQDILSILIPCNLDHEWIEPCFESVSIASSHLNTEVVVVANGMEESAISRLKFKAIRYFGDKLKFVESKSLNLASVLNDGLEAADGEYVARMDSDDLMSPDRLLVQLDYAKSNPNISVIGSSVRVINEQNVRLGTVKFPLSNFKIQQQLKFGNVFSHPTVLVKKEAIHAVGGYSNKFPHAEDYDLWLRLSEAGHLFANLNEELVFYRIHENQISNLRNEQQKISTRLLIYRELSKQKLANFEVYFQEGNLMTEELAKKISRETIKQLFAASDVSYLSRVRNLHALAIADLAIIRSSSIYDTIMYNKVIMARSLLLKPNLVFGLIVRKFKRKIMP